MSFFAAQHVTKRFGGLVAVSKVDFVIEQGMIAGLNMSGNPTKYKGTIISNTLKITGIDLYSAGEFNAEDASVYTSSANNTYKKFLLKENPIAAIVLGDKEAFKIAQKVMDGREDYRQFIKLIQG